MNIFWVAIKIKAFLFIFSQKSRYHLDNSKIFPIRLICKILPFNWIRWNVALMEPTQIVHVLCDRDLLKVSHESCSSVIVMNDYHDSTTTSMDHFTLTQI